jgi:hypothetical protein
MNTQSLLLAALLLLLGAGAELSGAVPLMTSYQGRITANGIKFSGTGQFKFALVSPTDGASLWSNDGTSVAGSEPTMAVSLSVTDGLFTVMLGDTALSNMQPLSAEVFRANPALALRVWFDDGLNGSVALSPDTRLASVPYALSAEIPEGSITGAQLAPGAIGPERLASANNPEAGQVLTYDGARFNWADPGVAGSVWSVLDGNAYYNAGRIGVGTAQPSGGVHIANGGLAVTGESSPYTGAGKGVFIESNPTYGAHVFAFDYDAFQGRPLLLNYPGGNVGIGTLEPAAPLDVSAVWLTPNTTGVPNIRLSGPHPTLAWVENSFPALPRYSWIAHLGGSGDLAFWHRLEALDGTSTGEIVDTGWVPKVTITTEGGLNYAGELEKLETRERASATVRAADFNLGHSGRRGDPGRALVDGGSALHLNFEDWPHTIIGGNVGIGTTTPTAKLDVRATSGNTGIVGSSPAGTGVNGNSTSGSGVTAASISGRGLYAIGNPAIYAEWNPGGAQPYTAIFEGNVEITANSGGFGALGVFGPVFAGDFIERSDERLKQHIEGWESADLLDRIGALRPCTYELKDTPGKLAFGLIAQDVASLFPEIVSEQGRFGEQTGIMGINYGKLGVIAVAAIQEQQELIASQASKIASLEERLRRLEQTRSQRE